MADSGHPKIEDNPKIMSGPVLTNSPNAVLSKTLLGRYYDLPLPADRILATYVWIDGTGEHLRCKDRTLNFIPKAPKDKLTRIIDEINETFTKDLWNSLEGTNERYFSPPYFYPKDLEHVFDVQCKRNVDWDSFDENLKGFPLI